MVFLGFSLLFSLSTPSATSMFLLIVSVGVLLSENPTIGSKLSAIFLFAFVEYMLLLLEGESQIDRLGFDGG